MTIPNELRPVLAMILQALDRDAAEGKAARGEMAGELRTLLAQPDAPTDCKCSMRQRMTGDGCSACNPDRADDLSAPADGEAVEVVAFIQSGNGMRPAARIGTPAGLYFPGGDASGYAFEPLMTVAKHQRIVAGECLRVMQQGVDDRNRIISELREQLAQRDAKLAWVVDEHRAWAAEFGAALMAVMQEDYGPITDLAMRMPFDFHENGSPTLRSAALASAEVKQ